MIDIPKPSQFSEAEYDLLKCIKYDSDTDFVCPGNEVDDLEAFKVTLNSIKRFHTLGFARFGGFQKVIINSKQYISRYTVKAPIKIQQEMIETVLNHPEIYLESNEGKSNN